MSDTVNIPVTPGWTVVLTATSATTGTMSIAGGGQHALYTGIPPSELIGHRFTGELVPFSLSTGESLCVNTDRDKDTVVITEDS